MLPAPALLLVGLILGLFLHDAHAHSVPADFTWHTAGRVMLARLTLARSEYERAIAYVQLERATGATTNGASNAAR